MALCALLAVFVFLSVISLLLRYNYSGKLIAKVPGPKSWPLIGNALELAVSKDELFKFVRSMYRDYGEIVRLWGFHKKLVNIYSPNDAEIILSSINHIEKPEPYRFLRPWLGEGLLISNGNKWQYRRKLLTPAFHFTILKKFTKIFNKHTEAFLDQLHKEVARDKINPYDFVTELTLSTMCDTSMGIFLDEKKSERKKKYFQAVKSLAHCIVIKTTRLWFHVDFLFNLTSFGRIQKEALNEVHNFTNNIIVRRRNQNLNIQKLLESNDDDCLYGKKYTLAMLDLLLQYEREGKIDNEGIREEVDTFMFEGHDTVAMALFYMIIRLANEREVQDKIFEELTQIFENSDRLPTVDDLNEMKYLELCIKESLRLYPSVPVILRCFKEEIELSGFKIPAQTVAAIHIFDIHRRADIYPEPEKFIPERFLPENQNKIHPYAYIPFSAGPRNCIGQKFAMLEMKTVMCGLIRKFKLEPITKTEDIDFTIDLTLKPLHPMHVRFINRDLCDHFE